MLELAARDAVRRRLADRDVALHRVLDQFGRDHVADQRVERGRHDRVLAQPALGLLFLCLDADHAEFREGIDGPDHDLHHLEQVVGDDRHHHVQLELAGLGRQSDRVITALHMEHGLVEHLGQHRVDLAGHDRRTGLHGRQPDFVEAGRRARGEQTEVVGDARQRDRRRADRSREVGGIGLALHAFEKVVGRVQSQPGQFAEPRDHARMVFGMGVEAGAGGRPADAQPPQALGRSRHTVAVAPHRLGVSAELLTEAHRHRVLQVRAARLDDAVELDGLGLERVGQSVERGQQFVEAPERAEANRGRDRVVRRLRHVDVVVRPGDVLATLAAELLRREVGDHLVGVHVVRGAGAGLERVDHEHRVPLPVHHFLRRGDDRVDQLLRRVLLAVDLAVREQPERAVDLGGRALDRRHAPDERAPGPQARDREVEDGALGLNAVEGLGRDLDLAKRVFFGAEVSHVSSLSKECLAGSRPSQAPGTEDGAARFETKKEGHARRDGPPATYLSLPQRAL